MRAWTRKLLEVLGWTLPTEVIARLSEDYPEAAALPPGIVHVVGGRTWRKWAYFKCPCGCGTLIMLALVKGRRPRWDIFIDWLDRPTLKPSVWQSSGCFSHFFVKQGRIEWCHDTGHPPPDERRFLRL